MSPYWMRRPEQGSGARPTPHIFFMHIESMVMSAFALLHGIDATPSAVRSGQGWCGHKRAPVVGTGPGGPSNPPGDEDVTSRSALPSFRQLWLPQRRSLPGSKLGEGRQASLARLSCPEPGNPFPLFRDLGRRVWLCFLMATHCLQFERSFSMRHSPVPRARLHPAGGWISLGPGRLNSGQLALRDPF